MSAARERELTAEEVAAFRLMEAIHRFAAECLVLFGDDSPIGLTARRVAQRARYSLIDGLDPDLEEIRGHVTAQLEARRARLAALTTTSSRTAW